jgi:hypothetical protein
MNHLKDAEQYLYNNVIKFYDWLLHPVGCFIWVFVALRCVALRCVALCCVVLCCVVLCFVSFRFVLFCFVLLRFVLFCLFCFVLFCFVVLCCVALRCVVLCCVVLCCVVLCCVVLCCVVLWRFLLYLLVFSTHELGKRRRWTFFRGTSLALSIELVRRYQPSAASVSEGVELRLVNDIHVSRDMFCFQVYTTKCLCCLLVNFFSFDVSFLQIQILCNNTSRYRGRPALLFVPKLSSYNDFNNKKTKPN